MLYATLYSGYDAETKDLSVDIDDVLHDVRPFGVLCRAINVTPKDVEYLLNYFHAKGMYLTIDISIKFM